LSSPLAINPSCFGPNLAHVAFALLGRKNSSKKSYSNRFRRARLTNSAISSSHRQVLNSNILSAKLKWNYEIKVRNLEIN